MIGWEIVDNVIEIVITVNWYMFIKNNCLDTLNELKYESLNIYNIIIF